MADAPQPSKDMETTPTKAAAEPTTPKMESMDAVQPATEKEKSVATDPTPVKAEVKEPAAETMASEMPAEAKEPKSTPSESKKKHAEPADKGYYGKSSVGKWILIYVIAAIIIYGLIYFFLLNRSGY